MVHAPPERASTPTRAAEPAGQPEQMRARYPDVEGFVERDDGRVGFEVYGAGDPPIMFVPPWSIVHSRIWKAQVPDFARRHRVVTWDARGNGRSDRPRDPAAHSDGALARDLLAVLDASGTDAAILVGLSGAAVPAIMVATEHPDRVLGLVLIGPAVPLGVRPPERNVPFDAVLDTDEGWAKQTLDFWRRDFGAYLSFFFSEMFNEPHSTKQIEDGVDYGSSTDHETLGSTMYTESLDTDTFRRMCAAVRCPVLIIQGDRDAITGLSRGIELARAMPRARFEIFEGAGHGPNARDPIRVNLLIREFVRDLARSA